MGTATGLLEREDFPKVARLALVNPPRLLTDVQAAAIANVLDEIAAGEYRTTSPIDKAA